MAGVSVTIAHKAGEHDQLFGSVTAKDIAGKTYTESEEVKRIAEAVIAKRNLNLMGARVRYMECSPKIAKTTCAKCSKVGTYAGIATSAPSGGMLIDGSVGIGVSVPSVKLDVGGDIKASGTIYGNLAQGTITEAYLKEASRSLTESCTER
jgi:hypothetical protein